MNTNYVRWEQRFSNYNKAFEKLEQAVRKIKEDYLPNDEKYIDADAFLDDIIKEGVIQRFEYTHELAWNVMKDFLTQAGNTNIYGSRDATREAFAADLIVDGDLWMEMIKSRNQTAHTYNEKTADDIFSKIINEYYPLFIHFRDTMEGLRSKQ
ncbi:MAG: nucleotidyltransferase substrate binding protein [Armatimonadetes bacterium]|nr:nucleotidyltransferase substrate binding protein [Armatimonadota bacterium]